jgi:tRNA-dihydrouridine synthase
MVVVQILGLYCLWQKGKKVIDEKKEVLSELVLAPLRGVTGVDYRNVFCRHFTGLDSAIAPFIPTVNGNVIKPKLLADILPEQNKNMPVVPQIIGKEPSDIIVLAKTIYDLGYDEVNWNLGCPWKFVAKKMRGSGLLPHPDKVDAILDKVLGSISGKFSVKVRLGMKSEHELKELIPVLNNHQLSEVIIHPRTAVQMYEGVVDVDMFDECYELLTHKVVYNGDITSVEFYKELKTRFPDINKWMIGRGVIINPLLPAEIKGAEPLPVSDYTLAIKAFHDDILDSTKERLSGPGHILGRMKELWKYMALSFDGSNKKLSRILRSKTVAEYEVRIDDFFDCYK